MTIDDRGRRAPGDYIRDTEKNTKGTRSVMKWLFAFIAAAILGIILFSYAIAPIFTADDPSKRSTITNPTTKPK